MSASFLVNGSIPTGAILLTAGATVTLSLADTSGAATVEWEFVGASEATTYPTITITGRGTASFTAPAVPAHGRGLSMVLQCRNAGNVATALLCVGTTAQISAMENQERGPGKWIHQLNENTSSTLLNGSLVTGVLLSPSLTSTVEGSVARVIANGPRDDTAPTRLIDYAAQSQIAASSVQTIYDTGAARLNATQAAGGNRVNVVALPSGEHVMRFVRATPTHYDTNAYTKAQQGRPYSVTARFSLNSLGADQNFLGMYGAGTELHQFYVSSGNIPWIWIRDGAAVIKQIFWPTAIAANEEHVLTAVVNGIHSALIMDGVAVLGDLSGLTTPVWTGSKVGAANAAAANALNADLFRLVMNDGPLTAGEWRNIYRQVTGNRPCLRLVCDGNSITLGQGSSDAAHRMPNQLQTLLGTNCVGMSNIGVGGATTTSRASNWASQALPVIYPYSDMVAVVSEATNDIYFGADAATAAANLFQWCDMYRHAGCKVVLWDIIARENFTAPQRAVAVQCNTLIAASAAQHCDAFVKASEAFPSYTDETYYDPDHVHLNDAGYLRLANLLLPYVKQVASLL